jgi:hypothetical protein
MTRPGTRLSNGSDEVDVEFPTLEESTVEPPNPAYLKVHAAFAKVLHLSGAAQYIGRVERDAEMEGTLRLDGKTDFASYLQSKIWLQHISVSQCLRFDSFQCSWGLMKSGRNRSHGTFVLGNLLLMSALKSCGGAMSKSRS